MTTGGEDMKATTARPRWLDGRDELVLVRSIEASLAGLEQPKKEGCVPVPTGRHPPVCSLDTSPPVKADAMASLLFENTSHLMAWLLPCLMMVATNPL